VTLHFKQPNGVEAATVPKTADASGTYSQSYVSTTSTTTGTWEYWAVDNSTALASNHVTFTISQLVNPQVSVSPTSGQQGTTFSEPGTGFTPNGGVTLHFKQPNGVEAATVPKTADAGGAYSQSYASTTATSTGSWEYWAVDNSTALASNHVTFTISP
jgi:hypothetical protein